MSLDALRPSQSLREDVLTPCPDFGARIVCTALHRRSLPPRADHFFLRRAHARAGLGAPSSRCNYRCEIALTIGVVREMAIGCVCNLPLGSPSRRAFLPAFSPQCFLFSLQLCINIRSKKLSHCAVSTFGGRCVALRITPGKPSSDSRANFLGNQIIHAAVSILVLLLDVSRSPTNYSLSNWLPSYGDPHFSAAPQASE